MAEKILIASGKGGTGKSSVCVGLGRALCTLGKRVLIIDCDCLRSIDMLTGITFNLVYDWGDVIFGRCGKDDAVYYNGDFRVLTCPYSYDGISDEDMRQLVSLYDEDYDYILFDAPGGVDRGFRLPLSVCDRAVVVVNTDPIRARSACITGRMIMRSGLEDVRLVVNNVSKKDVAKGNCLNVDEVIDTVALRLLGVIPEDENIRLSSMGKPFYRRGQPCFQPLTNIAKRICGENIPLKL